MINNFKYQLILFKYFSKVKFILLILFLSISIDMVIGITHIVNLKEQVGYLELLNYILGIRQIIFCNLLFFLTSSYYLYNMLNNDSFRTRSNNLEKYNRRLLLTIFCQNLFLYIIKILLLLAVIGISKNCIHGFYYLETKGTYNVFYFLIFIIRYYLVAQLLSMIGVVLLKKLNPKIGLIISIGYIMYVFFQETIMPMDIVITSINELGLKFSYFLLYNNYGSIIFEITVSILYILLLILILKIINGKSFNLIINYVKKIFCKRKKVINNTKNR